MRRLKGAIGQTTLTSPKMEIQFSEEKKNKLSPVPQCSVKSEGFRHFLPISCPSVSNVRCVEIAFSVHVTAGFSSLPICLRIRTSIRRPLVTAVTYVQQSLTVRLEVCIPGALS